ncbi:MAG: hypothetical protein J4G13_13670 [Dehalococcoidia bacterium]|nr:hypothetical protein [Dehalococcoidia bacterium]
MVNTENLRPIEVTGQVWGVQLAPPGESDGGTFQLLLENGSIVTAPYPKELHQPIASALQANDVILVRVTGIGEHLPSGELQRIVEPESITRCWAPAPNRLFEKEAPDWETPLVTSGKMGRRLVPCL